MKFIKRTIFLLLLIIPFFVGVKEVNAGWIFSPINSTKPKPKDECVGENYYFMKATEIVYGGYRLEKCHTASKTSDETFKICMHDPRKIDTYISANSSQYGNYTASVEGGIKKDSNGLCSNNYWRYSDHKWCWKCIGTNYTFNDFVNQSKNVNEKIQMKVKGKSYYYELANKNKACKISEKSNITKVCDNSKGYYYVNINENPQLLNNFEYTEACVNYQSHSFIPIVTFSTNTDFKYGGFFDYFTEYIPGTGKELQRDNTCQDGYIRKGGNCYECEWVNIGSNPDIIDKKYEKFDCGVLSEYLNKIWVYILIAAPVMVIIFSAIDLLKAVAANEEKDIKKQGSRIVKRLIIMMVVIILPLIVNMIIGLTSHQKLDACLNWQNNYKTQEDDKIYSYVGSCPKGKIQHFDPYKNIDACFNSIEDAGKVQDAYDRNESRPNIESSDVKWTKE